MFTRVRFFFSDVRYWFSQRFRRRREPDAAGADATTQAEPEAADAGSAQAEAETPSPAAADTAETEAVARKRRLPRPRLRRPAVSRPRVRRPQLRRPHLRRPEFSIPPLDRDRLPSRRGVLVFLAGAAVATAIAAALVALDVVGGDDEESAPLAPRVVLDQQAESPADVGFPEFATANTTRIAGSDAVANSVGAALAAFPSRGGVLGPDAVTMVSADDWAAGIAASVLVSEPIRAPVLVGQADGVPDLIVDALVSLAPTGSSATADTQLFRIGDVAVPEGLRTRELPAGTPAEAAARIETLRQRLTDSDPNHILLASADEPAFAMPAAAWAARSGDPVLFVQRDSVPQATLNVLEQHKDVPVFLLGPESVASDEVVAELEDAGVSVERVAGEEPVTNAIAFARYVGIAGFGWNITDPGHGLVIANSTRPADAPAASALSASGKWGPLLLVENADVLPPALEGYLLDIKPGFIDDPTRAVYNHGWLVGNPDAISVDVQAQIDELLELTQVESGTGAPALGPPPGTPEDIPEPDTDTNP